MPPPGVRVHLETSTTRPRRTVRPGILLQRPVARDLRASRRHPAAVAKAVLANSSGIRLHLAMLTTDQILALSPDDSSAKAAKGLMAPAKWPMLGHDEVAIWGE